MSAYISYIRVNSAIDARQSAQERYEKASSEFEHALVEDFTGYSTTSLEETAQRLAEDFGLTNNDAAIQELREAAHRGLDSLIDQAHKEWVEQQAEAEIAKVLAPLDSPERPVETHPDAPSGHPDAEEPPF